MERFGGSPGRVVRSLTMFSVWVLVLAAVVVWRSAAPASASSTTVVGVGSGRCLNVAGGSATAGAAVQLWDCNGQTSEQWDPTPAGELRVFNDSMCLDAYQKQTTPGTMVDIWTCNGGSNQQWRINADGTITGVQSGLCLDASAKGTTNGTAIELWTCNGGTNQKWTTTSGTGTPTVAADGTGKYQTVQAAIDAVPANNTTPVTITIKAGTYREIVTIPSDKPYITLEGLGSSASSTVLVDNHSNAGGYGTAGSATVFVYGHDFTAQNLTISNDYGEGSQAVAANVSGQRAVFNGVHFLGAQDTLLVNDGARAYFVNNHIEGTVDFIFGGGTAVFNTCSIYEKRAVGGPVTAARTPATQTYGFLIYKSTIDGATTNATQLGRPWGPDAQVLYRESTLSATIATAQPWINMSTNVWYNARFDEYRNTGPGTTYNNNRPQMTDAQALTYTPQKYLAGSDGWNPIG